MKKLISILVAFILSVGVFAQAPQKMSYQAVIRNSSNTLITSTPVGMRISIIQGSIFGPSVYVETQTPSTNANGLVSLEVGSGVVVSGTFVGINWAAGPYFIKTETDPTGGTNYSIVGTNELMSVPYALFSANGTPGPTGLTGPQGMPGIQGIVGDTGAIGLTGATGSAGAQGPIGLTGAQGIVGDTGATGLTGAQGIQGLTGAVGATGSQGPIGLTGANGAIGATGLIGVTGAQGPIGLTGATGSQGPIGLAGATGAQGPIGLAGPTGAQGPIGLTGATGPTGVAGQGGVTTAGSGISITGAGTILSPYLVNAIGFSTTYSIGLWPALGGYVFRISTDGKHGLVAETIDQSNNSSWYSGQDVISNPMNHSTNGQNFMDWRLPTMYELNEMYTQRVAIGGFTNNNYWSSTENPSNGGSWAWRLHFSSGLQTSNGKNWFEYVRAVRAF